MNRYHEHQDLIKNTKLFLTQMFPKNLRLFDRTVGLFYAKRFSKGIIDYTPIQINRAGMADNYGVVICHTFTDKEKRFPLPIHFEVESKTGNAVLSEDQKNWRDFCFNFNIWWFENRNKYKLINDILKKAKSCGLVVDEINFK
jgi:hypothetical protein